MSKKKIKIKDGEVRVLEKESIDYICITDIAKVGKQGKGRAADFIKSYLKILPIYSSSLCGNN